MSRPTTSKAQTSYPIYAASFATNKPSTLIVGGGGGAGNHGVKNQITVFDFITRAPNVEASAELDVSQDDSVTCLANLATRDGLILYAGNSCSVQEKLQRNDMHFRSFEATFTPGHIAPLSRTMLFTPASTDAARREAYQRLMRLSPPQRSTGSTPNRRIGAIASALAGEENEVVIFSATTNRPQAQDVIQRISLKGQEANDIDIQDQGEGSFQVAYVLDHDVYVQDVNYDFGQRRNKTQQERRKVYTAPHAIDEKKARSKLRGVRWLSPKHLLLLSNKPSRTGVELDVLHLYDEGLGSVVSRRKLKSRVTAATDMDVAILDSDSDGACQIVVAVAGADSSLSVFTIDYHGYVRDSLSRLNAYAKYDEVHGNPITKAIFSPFYKPEAASGRSTTPQYLRLASTSSGNTISVETFELQSYQSRYVLQTARTRNLYSAATYLVLAMITAAVALMVQTLVDPAGQLTRGLVPASLQSAAIKTFGETHRANRQAAILNNANTPAVKVERRLRDLLHLHNPPPGSDSPQTEKALMIHHDAETDGTLSTEVHDGHEAVLKKHDSAKRWEELSHEDQQLWKKKLLDAGMWAVEEGETIFKSILFGQIGGVIGGLAQGVIG